jgi:hypothetical protein
MCNFIGRAWLLQAAVTRKALPACVLSFEKGKKDLCYPLLAVPSRLFETQVSCKLFSVVHCVDLGAGKKEHQHEALAC